MIDDAKKGVLKPGSVIIEPTSATPASVWPVKGRGYCIIIVSAMSVNAAS